MKSRNNEAVSLLLPPPRVVRLWVVAAAAWSANNCTGTRPEWNTVPVPCRSHAPSGKQKQVGRREDALEFGLDVTYVELFSMFRSK